MAITPVLWLIAFIIRFVLPQSFAKLATGMFLDWFAWAYDTERKPATALKGEITFHRDSIGTALTINAGTWIKTLPINGTVYRVKVTADTDFPVNAPSVRVPVEAEKTGTAYNLAAGYFTIMEEPVTRCDRSHQRQRLDHHSRRRPGRRRQPAAAAAQPVHGAG